MKFAKDKPCAASGCEKPVGLKGAKGLCTNHYRKLTYKGYLERPERPIEQRFWDRVAFTDDCWHWRGATTRGYGVLNIERTFTYAHRWVYQFLVGPIPDGTELDHLCYNRACVRPEHLEPVTHRENIRRGFAHKREMQGAT